MTDTGIDQSTMCANAIHTESTTKRTAEQLKHRWTLIALSSNKFCKALRMIEKTKQQDAPNALMAKCDNESIIEKKKRNDRGAQTMNTLQKELTAPRRQPFEENRDHQKP